MRQRAPLVLSITALVVAVLAATPLGQATVSKVAAKIPPFARTAGFARLSGNSNKLNNHKSTLRGLPGTIPVVGANGKLPASIGAVGVQGPAGPAGPKGDNGAQGPVGPTNGVASKIGRPSDYTNNTEIGTATSISVSSQSTLFVFGRVQSTVACTAGQGCQRHFGLWVDDQQVEGTLGLAYGIPGGNATDTVTVFGTINVSPGNHSIRFRAGNSQYVTAATDVYVNIGAIQLGSTP
jgi:hypothetical protein